MEQSEELNPIYGSPQWEKLNQKERDELGHHLSGWLFSQFLHGDLSPTHKLPGHRAVSLPGVDKLSTLCS
jgi:hypothetical protein